MSGGPPAFTGLARLVRGLILGALVLTISLTGHTAIGGGSLPDPTTLAVLLILSSLLSIAVADRRRSGIWLVADIAAMQVLLHVVATAVISHPSHAVALMPSWPMIFGHAIATILVAVALTRADNLWARWRRFLDDVAREFTLATLPTPLAGAAIATRRATPLVERYTAQPVLRRGPPAAAAR